VKHEAKFKAKEELTSKNIEYDFMHGHDEQNCFISAISHHPCGVNLP
jgi:hypothetical protein